MANQGAELDEDPWLRRELARGQHGREMALVSGSSSPTVSKPSSAGRGHDSAGAYLVSRMSRGCVLLGELQVQILQLSGSLY